MENRKQQQPIPEALQDEQLEAVTGGQSLLNNHILTPADSYSEERIKQLLMESEARMRDERKQYMNSALDQIPEFPGPIETSGPTLSLK